LLNTSLKEFPSLSERSSFLTEVIALVGHAGVGKVSISFREKFLPDKDSEYCTINEMVEEFPSLSERSSFLTHILATVEAGTQK